MSARTQFPVLVTGAKGMLAHDLIPRLRAAGCEVIPFDLPELDITAPSQVRAAVGSVASGLVINCAAYTAVDRAESDSDTAFSVNRDGASTIADACAYEGVPLIHLSTDYVFDGNDPRPRCETDPAFPLNVYGQSKWEGEEAIRERLTEHFIVRSSWLFAAQGSNFVVKILRLACERDEIRVVNDQHGRPTWTGDLADALVMMACEVVGKKRPIPWGTYHYAGDGATTWYDFACAIVEAARPHCEVTLRRVIPIATSEYPAPAVRPAWSILDTSHFTNTFGRVPAAWPHGLSEVMGRLTGR